MISGPVWFDRDRLRWAWRLLSSLGRPSRVRGLDVALLEYEPFIGEAGGRATLSAVQADGSARVELPCSCELPGRLVLVRDKIPDAEPEPRTQADYDDDGKPLPMPLVNAIGDLDEIQLGGFGAILSRLKGPEVFLDPDPCVATAEQPGRVLTRVRCGRTSIDLEPMDPDAVFSDPPVDRPGCYEADGRTLLAAVEAVRTLAGKDTPRYGLDGLAFESFGRDGVQGEKRVSFVATDGQRLGHAWLSARDAGADHSRGLVIPPAGARRLAAFLARIDPGPVEFGVDDARFFVRIPGASIAVQASTGRFPAWRDAIPRGNGRVLALDAAAAAGFRVAMAQARCVDHRHSRQLSVSFWKDRIEVSAFSVAGEARAWVDVGGARPGPSLVFDGRLFGKTLLHVPDGPIELVTWRPEDPIMLRTSTAEFLVKTYVEGGGG